jgi:hypothetical protein
LCVLYKQLIFFSQTPSFPVDEWTKNIFVRGGLFALIFSSFIRSAKDAQKNPGNIFIPT